MSLELALQILMMLPPLQFGDTKTPTKPAEGTGTLLIAACNPGESVLIKPGNLMGYADENGIVKIQAPAQNEDDGSYQLSTLEGSVTFNGTLTPSSVLSSVCP